MLAPVVRGVSNGRAPIMAVIISMDTVGVLMLVELELDSAFLAESWCGIDCGSRALNKRVSSFVVSIIVVGGDSIVV